MFNVNFETKTFFLTQAIKLYLIYFKAYWLNKILQARINKEDKKMLFFCCFFLV